MSEFVDLELKNAFKLSISELLDKEMQKSFFARDRKKVRALERALRNDAILDRLVLKFGAEMSASITSAEGDGRFFEIIQWIIDNQDSILKFILALIEIFG